MNKTAITITQFLAEIREKGKVRRSYFGYEVTRFTSSSHSDFKKVFEGSEWTLSYEDSYTSFFINERLKKSVTYTAGDVDLVENIESWLDGWESYKATMTEVYR